MGSKLSSLLVQEGLVPVKKLEDALAMQAILGGQLDTILLEKGLVDEATLLSAVARATGLPPAVGDLLSPIGPAGEVVDVDTARKLGVCPISVDSRNLSLLVSEATDPFALEDLAFQLDRTIRPFVTIELRILEARSQVYGEPLDPRFVKLLERYPTAPEQVEQLRAAPPRTIEPSAKDRAPSPEPVTVLEPLKPEPAQPEEPAEEQPAPDRERPEEPAREERRTATPDRRSRTDTDLPKVMLDPDLAEASRALEPPVALPESIDGMPPIPEDADEVEEPDELPDQELIPEDEPEPPPPPSDEDDEDEGEEPTDPGRRPVLAESWEETTDPGPPLGGDAESEQVVEVTAELAGPAPDDFAEDTDPEMKLGIAIQDVDDEPLALTTEMVLEAQPPPRQEQREATVPALQAPTIEEPPVASEGSGEEEPPADAPSPDEPTHPAEPIQPAEPTEETGPEETGPEETASEPDPRAPSPDLSEQGGLDRLLEQIHAAQSRDELLVAAARGLLLHVDGVKLYVVKGRLLVGHLELDADGVASDAIQKQPPLSLEIPTVLARAVESGSLYLGTAPNTDASVSVLAAAGILRPRGLVLMPVVIRTKTVCLALGWSPDRPVPSASRAPLARLTREVALGMAELIVRLKRTSTQEPDVPAQEPATPPGPDAEAQPFDDRRTEEMLPVKDRRVISDIGAPAGPPDEAPDLITLLHQLEQGGAAAEQAERSIAALGKDAVQALISWFPGRVRAGRLDQDLPPVAECSAVLQALVIIGRPVLSSIAPLLLHPDPDARFYATYLISELIFPEAVALLARQLSDPDPAVRRLAGRVLRQFRQMPKFPQVVLDLRTDLLNPDPRPRRGAVEALGALGDEGAVAALVGLLQDHDPMIAQTVRNALISITKQDYRTLDDWEAWWVANRHRTRIEWLIDGLGHEDAAIRASAATEIEELTGKTFGYTYDMPRRERDAIRRRFLEWWSLQK